MIFYSFLKHLQSMIPLFDIIQNTFSCFVYFETTLYRFIFIIDIFIWIKSNITTRNKFLSLSFKVAWEDFSPSSKIAYSFILIVGPLIYFTKQNMCKAVNKYIRTPSRTSIFNYFIKLHFTIFKFVFNKVLY